MKCLRLIGMSARRAIHPARRADAWYCAFVKPPGPYVKPSCSIPTDCVFTFQLPACQATSERWTSWTILPRRPTTKWEDACARALRSQRTEPQKVPSVTWTTTLSSDSTPRCDLVKLPSPFSQTTGGRAATVASAVGTATHETAIAAATTCTLRRPIEPVAA